MHPEVEKYIEEFEQAAKRNGSYRKTLGKLEKIFLQEIWGPLHQFNFKGLIAEYPFKDFKGGDRFIDFAFPETKLIVELDGFTTHARDISPGEFDDHLTRQNDLILAGWMILRFSSNQVEKNPTLCQRQISQALGHWWSLTQYNMPSEDRASQWTNRRSRVIRLSLKQDGIIKARDVAKEFGLSVRSAHDWLSRFQEEGILVPVCLNERITAYKLKNYDKGGQC